MIHLYDSKEGTFNNINSNQNIHQYEEVIKNYDINKENEQYYPQYRDAQFNLGLIYYTKYIKEQIEADKEQSINYFKDYNNNEYNNNEFAYQRTDNS